MIICTITLIFIGGIFIACELPGDSHPVNPVIEPMSGVLDTNFGISGIIKTDLGAAGNTNYDQANAIVQNVLGDIFVAGSSRVVEDRFAVAKYSEAGVLDPTFGVGGIVFTDVSFLAGNNSDGRDIARAIVCTSDGGIIAAGYSSLDGSAYNDFCLVKYTSSGALDTDFDTDGIATTDFGPMDGDAGTSSDDTLLAMILDSSNRIIAVGGGSNGSDHDFAIARYNSNGSLDTTFNASGVVPGLVLTDFGGIDTANAVKIDSTGRIIVAGRANASEFAVACYNPDGTLDTTFGTNGKATVDIASTVYEAVSAIAIDYNDNIIIAGQGRNNEIDKKYEFVLTQFTSSGILDTGFGINGVVRTDIDGNSATGDADKIVFIEITEDNKILAAGYGTTHNSESNSPNDDKDDYVALRYNSDGSLDTSFGINGIFIQDAGSYWDEVRDAVFTADEQLIIVGKTKTGEVFIDDGVYDSNDIWGDGDFCLMRIK